MAALITTRMAGMSHHGQEAFSIAKRNQSPAAVVELGSKYIKILKVLLLNLSSSFTYP